MSFEFMNITDKNESMKIWNYKNEVLKDKYELRGCITDNEDKIICPSLGHIQEYNIDTLEEGNRDIKNPKEWLWTYAMEGTMLRLYNYKGEWFLSTHKKISAFHSRWSCKFSFGELFINVLEEIFPEKENVYEYFLSQLSKDKMYYFLLRSNYQNRIICLTSSLEMKDKIIFIGSRKNSDFRLNTKGEEEILNHLSYFKYIDHTFQNFNDILHFVEEKIDPFQYQGLFGYNPKTEHFIKIMNSKYKELVKVRGNNHNLRFRYLEIRNDKVLSEKLYMLYPKFTSIFDEYEKLIHKITRKIYRVYIERYIHLKYITLPKEEYIILRKCNEWFLKNKDKRVTIDEILNIINQENPYYLYKMIQRVKNEENVDIQFYKNKMNSNSLESLQSFYKNN